MQKIALINCHFGKLPNYLPFFLKSASTIKCLDIFIMTNDDVSSYREFCVTNGFKNIFFKDFKINDLESIVSRKLSVEYKMPSVRKICDWKTAYNFIFSEITNEYEYWGHCDIDIIFGDVDGYLNDILGKYDIISGDKNRLCGPFTIFKKELGNVFQLHPNWSKIMLEMDHIAYDERDLDKAVKSNDQLSVCYGMTSKGLMQNYGSPHLQPPLRIPANWNNGKLTINEDGRETMFIHMGHKNQIINVEFKNENFEINDTGFC